MAGKHSIQRRVSIGFLAMTLMVVTAGITGVAFTLTAERANQAVRSGMAAQARLNIISAARSDIVGVLNEAIGMAPSSPGEAVQTPPDQLEASYQDNIAALEQALIELHTEPPGSSPAARQQYLTILDVMSQTTAALKDSGEEILELAVAAGGSAAGREAARQVRDTRVLVPQRSLHQNLGVLGQMIQGDIDRALTNAQRMSHMARLAWGGLAVLGALFGIYFTVFFTRSIVRPIQELTRVVQRVTSRDFSPLKPNPRQDELGELWSSLALLTDWLRESYENLETRVSMRTRALERRSTQMQVAAEVARDASSVRNLDALLSNAVELIRGRFGFYHAGIYLNDERGEYTILQAATGDAGRQMLAQGYRLQIGEVGVVGNVAQTGKPRIAAGADSTPGLSGAGEASSDHSALLPATRAEMALPLKIGEKVIGVLDVQSQFSSAFSQEDVNALQILADQLAVAIENARLINDYQESLRELEAVYLRLSRGAWADIKRSRANSGYVYDLNGIKPLENRPAADATQSSAAESSGDHLNLHKVDIPLHVRGNRIGSLEIWLHETQYNPQVEYFLQQLSPRLSQSLETARLYQETQERAARERMVGEISGHIRETLNIDSVLRTAAAEIRSALGLNDLTIRLEGSAPHHYHNGNGNGGGERL